MIIQNEIKTQEKDQIHERNNFSIASQKVSNSMSKSIQKNKIKENKIENDGLT